MKSGTYILLNGEWTLDGQKLQPVPEFTNSEQKLLWEYIDINEEKAMLNVINNKKYAWLPITDEVQGFFDKAQKYIIAGGIVVSGIMWNGKWTIVSINEAGVIIRQYTYLDGDPFKDT
jgi:hypothetical protein